MEILDQMQAEKSNVTAGATTPEIPDSVKVGIEIINPVTTEAETTSDEALVEAANKTTILKKGSSGFLSKRTGS